MDENLLVPQTSTIVAMNADMNKAERTKKPRSFTSILLSTLACHKSTASRTKSKSPPSSFVPPSVPAPAPIPTQPTVGSLNSPQREDDELSDHISSQDSSPPHARTLVHTHSRPHAHPGSAESTTLIMRNVAGGPSAHVPPGPVTTSEGNRSIQSATDGAEKEEFHAAPNFEQRRVRTREQFKVAYHTNQSPLLATSAETTAAGTIIYSKPLQSLRLQHPVVITPDAEATTQRYRLLNCKSFVEHDILQIEEFAEFPSIPYSAISYVWRGNATKDQVWTFAVEGAMDADPISIEVLRRVCITSLQLGPEYVWLDRMCIMQTSKEDKTWQIKRMNLIYRSCSQCIVLPAGLGRLVHLHEQTSWIHRAWTLQEALSPRNTMVLFSWKLDSSGQCMSGDESGTVHEVLPGDCAVSQLATIVNACAVGELLLVRPKYNTAIPARIFGSDSPNVRALAVTMSDVLSEDADARNHAIWQCALMRTSSRPVDMVFSIMGLFGVTLDPNDFDKNDRLGATVGLAQQILKNEGRASWLGASFRMQPSRHLSSFPQFPRTRVAGKALVETSDGMREAANFMDGEYPNDQALGMAMPEGRMNDEGYFTFSRKSARIVPEASQDVDSGHDTGHEPLVALDGTSWKIEDGSGDTEVVRTYAVLLGWFQRYHPGASLAAGVKIKVILVEEHNPGQFHVKSFFSLDRRFKDTVLTWRENTFSVGGPDGLSLVSSTDTDIPEAETYTEVSTIDDAKGSMRWAEYFYLTEPI
ncbi:hypothetical protein HWV62_23390 [Athelia sp. TMB]|nr:hypothetical protein HWV62_23390 [Athelia sp. TMB]